MAVSLMSYNHCTSLSHPSDNVQYGGPSMPAHTAAKKLLRDLLLVSPETNVGCGQARGKETKSG